MSTAMTSKGSSSSWSPFVKIYDPLKAGSIDGTDLIPHDNAVIRAIVAEYSAPDCASVASQTLFVGRLNLKTSERQLHEEFSKYGQVKSCRLVKDIVTGISRGYGFVEYKKEADAQKAWKLAHSSTFHERQILVEWEFARTMPGWIPRRLGGGLGGKKESGQLRFGGRDRPFKRPLILPSDNDDGGKLEEVALNGSETKATRNERDKRYSPGNYYNESNKQFKRFNEDKFPNQSYYVEDKRRYKNQTEEKYSDQSKYEEERRKFHKKEGKFVDESSYYNEGRRKFRNHTEEKYPDQSYFEEGRQKYQRHTEKKYSDQYYYEGNSKNYKNYREDKYVEKSKYSKDYASSNDKSFRKEYDKRSNKSEYYQRDFGSSSYYEEERETSKKNKQYAEEENDSPSSLVINTSQSEPKTSRDDNKYNLERTRSETLPRRKRKHSSSSDSSNSHLHSSTKKHKKRKHKKNSQNSDSSESGSTKRHKKKKKKKSRKKGEQD